MRDCRKDPRQRQKKLLQKTRKTIAKVGGSSEERLKKGRGGKESGEKRPTTGNNGKKKPSRTAE